MTVSDISLTAGMRSNLLNLQQTTTLLNRTQQRLSSGKEDCPDLRNSKVVDIIGELKDYGMEVQVCDPLADPAEAQHEYGVTLVPRSQLKPAVAVVAAVAHAEYRAMGSLDVAALMGNNPVLVDVKRQYDRQLMAAAGIRTWTL